MTISKGKQSALSTPRPARRRSLSTSNRLGSSAQARGCDEAKVNEPFDLSVYKETLLFLVTAGVVAPRFFRLRVSPVLGYLLAGVALGPYGLGAIAQRAPWLSALAINVEAIDRMAAFGVVAVLFSTGVGRAF